MEPYNQRSVVFELLSKFTEPAKYKIRFYQLVVAMCIETLLSLFISKYVIFRLKIEEKKNQINYHFNIEQTLLLVTTRIDLIASQVLQKSFELFTGMKERLANGFAKIQSMNEDCLTHDETPELFCEPYIHTGFRPINKPYMYYVKSLFKKHNETVNAWSHYLGAVYTLSWAFRLDFADPYSWPILTTIITSTIMFFASATAHLMHQKSHWCHMTCFLCDFAGISFNGFGAALMQTYICSPIWYFKLFEPYLLPAIGIQSALCCLFNCLAQTAFKRPYPPLKRILQFAPCGILWIFTILPLFLPYLASDNGNDKVIHVSYAYHLGHIFLFLIGAAFFALDFPQRFFPGKLDFIGQGHHLFHVCIFFVVTLQLEGIYKDYVINRELIAASRDPPTLVFCFISLGAVIVYYLYLIRKFNSMITHNFDSEGNYIGAREECDKYKDLECEHHVANEEPVYHDASDDEKAFRERAALSTCEMQVQEKKEN